MKLKIINHKKFKRNIALLLLTFCFILLGFTHRPQSKKLVEYKTITVQNGDTLWSIAQYEQLENTYYKDVEIRKIVSNIKKINNLQTSNLSENQNLKIPITTRVQNPI